ncbi:MAG TPA: preprotein translocase subunit YajC [Gaiellaceae bacterium]|nr:preprotein translocase subunit YajC [Gaiellaceae bacterium]
MLGASSGSSFFFLIVVAFVFIWFMVIRPQKKRQVQAARMLNTLNVGDQVVTAGGMYGEVTALHDDDVMVRIAPETEVRIARKAIGAVIPPEDDSAERDEPESEPHEPAGA